MLVLLVVLLAAAAACGWLGAWQLDRAVARGEQRAAAAAADAAQAPARPLDEVLAPQTTFGADMVAARVTTSGEFESGQVLVTGRVLDGRTGSIVVAPLRVTSTGAVLAVAVGWVADGEPAPASPTGAVELTGWLQVGEAAGEATALADGEAAAISPAELVNRWGGPTYTGYLVLEEPVPAGVAALAAPGREAPGLNLQNLAYALQWWLFGGFAAFLWWRTVRDEVRADREEEAAASGVSGADAPAASP
jgi:cytochrome oxidase assembly protein ShyY1